VIRRCPAVAAAAAIATCLASASCDAPTQLVVLLGAEPAALSEALALRVRACNDERQIRVDRTLALATDPPDVIFPVRVPTHPRDEDASRRLDLVADLLGSGDELLARQRVVGGYVAGEIREVARTFDSACVRKLDCGRLETCRAGACESAVEPPLVLPMAPCAPAQISLRGVEHRIEATAVSSIELSIPPMAVPGDVIVASVDVRTRPVLVTRPSGWELVWRDEISTVTKSTYVRVLAAGDPATATWTFDVPAIAIGVALAYSGVDAAQPVDSAIGQPNDSSSTFGVPPVMTTVDAAMIVAFFTMQFSVDVLVPEGMTERVDVSTGASNLSSAAADRLGERAGTIDVGDATTAGGASPNIVHVVALRPAGGPSI